jgi:type II secretory pathway component PulF
MNAQQPSSSGEQEMDLLDIFSLLGRAFNNLMRFFFRIVDYLLKFWWIIILLIIGGAALGYFTKGEPSYKAELLLKTNFKII